MTPGPVTIADVARHAGVSASTVSYVLSGKRAISAVTREKVLASVRALGFHPHAGARALAGNRSNIIALALPLRAGINVPVVMQFAAAVVDAARAGGYDVLLVTADEGAAGLRRVAGSALVDGLILMDVETDDERVPALRELSRPSVLIGLPADPTGLVCVDLDFARAGELCVEHLAALGHRRVALLGAPQAVYDRGTGFARRTRDGVRAAALRCGVHADAVPLEPVFPAALEALSRLGDTTALIVHNEGAVDHVLTALRTLGRRVPDDVSVLAICPDDVALAATPNVSNVQIPAAQLGRLAVDRLLERDDDTGVPAATLLPPMLTTRLSSLPPPIRSVR
ncbi:LacI family DNA-binding transcriptional regulator [Actinoplanes sp. LDG1-06]|uniref:LacI family DNA-binding transcriptional regulator n=1 Tax=Paractinoplanes ovalisporus TaxID=2810368 RepID=A0ABS2A3T7_9ACTN|nr:LacI family DNA-binding transcriptional regulator [Actinoplanes ovalisporus]MBM2614503.1 LacI family DNA-binding transcriptional regulator [Actinoplanes ovalisporus]